MSRTGRGRRFKSDHAGRPTAGGSIPRQHSLTSEETLALFTEPAAETLFDTLGEKPSKQRQFLRRLLDALSHPVPETFVEKPFRGVDHLRQFRAGDQLRGYCLFETDVPGHELFVFFGITEHDYDRQQMRKYDRRAGRIAETIRDLQTEAEVTRYLDERDPFDAEAVVDLMHRLDVDPPPDWTD